MKLTTLLFGLLLAVGWTGNVFAQQATYTAESIKDLTYTWVDANNATQTSHYVEYDEQKKAYVGIEVTNPYQMYGLLRGVYMETALPGPYYSAYTPLDVREDPTYYGPVAGGWEILNVSPSGNAYSAVGNITITMDNGNLSFQSIQVKSGGTVLTEWSYASNNTSLPTGWSTTKAFTAETATNSCFMSKGGTITINASLLQDATNVTVEIYGRHDTQYAAAVTITVAGSTGTSSSQTIPQEGYTDWQTFTWNVNGNSISDVNPDSYHPQNEGYTVVVVKLNNTTSPIGGGAVGLSTFTTKQQIIDYFATNVASMKLLTDGIRIGSGYNAGTVFNCSGEYNRFFFLGKGQARKKSNYVTDLEQQDGNLRGEQVPFKNMFEQFSPTTGDEGSDITDFYSKMMQGNVYNVVHDCGSVIEVIHEFSMSGHNGTTAYAMTGMNFFIPDYRLKFWINDNYYVKYTDGSTAGPFVVDGRVMNPFQTASETEYSVDYVAGSSRILKPRGTAMTPSNFAANYAQYNQPYAPRVGIYLLHLEAEANKVADYSESNRYYNVDLDWTSSLNEMSGNGVSQTYIIYQVVTDSVTGELVNVPIDTVENCTDFRPELRLDTLYEQQAHSYTLTYVIQGWPSDSDHPSFIAWSNQATVIIPGYDDFMTLNLHHYESDFDVNYKPMVGKNYYRNYMSPENDFANGITPDAIKGGYDSFILYRTSTDGKVPVAKLKLAVDSQNRVRYKITYFDENEDYTGPNDINIQQIINNLINN